MSFYFSAGIEYNTNSEKTGFVKLGESTLEKLHESIVKHINYYLTDVQTGYTLKSVSINKVCGLCYGDGVVPHVHNKYRTKVCSNCKGKDSNQKVL